ncbi:MAG: hypothetical protein LBN05_05725 [Oscillospiraceae bacterium]|jgi:hypothetical protein|nr:hypothetical protein [Oscillospiraceae bacterium]
MASTFFLLFFLFVGFVVLILFPEIPEASATTTTVGTVTYTGSTQLILPEHTYSVFITSIGGGGGGGGVFVRGYDGITSATAGIASAAAGGGGGGGYNTATINNIAQMQNNRVLDITVGIGGGRGSIGNPGNNNCSTASGDNAGQNGGNSYVTWNGGNYATANGGKGGTSAACNSNTGVGSNNKKYQIGGGGAKGTPVSVSATDGDGGVSADWNGAVSGMGGLGPNAGTKAAAVGSGGRNSGWAWQGTDASCIGCGGAGAAGSEFDNDSSHSAGGGLGARGEVTVTYSYYQSDTRFNTCTPASGYSVGGNDVTVSGAFFNQVDMSSLKVSLGGQQLSIKNYDVGGSTLTVTMPAHAQGRVSLDFMWTDNQYGFTDWAATIPDCYLYIGVSLELAFPSIGVGLSMSGSTPYAYDYSDIRITTNNPIGYKLYISAAGDIDSGAPQDVICPNNQQFRFIPTTSGALGDNTWGIQIADTVNHAGWLTPVAADMEFSSSGTASGPAQNGEAYDSHRLWVGAKTDGSLPPCVYETNVLITAITNP